MAVIPHPGYVKKDLFIYRVLQFILFAGIAGLACLADRALLDLESISPSLGISQKFVYYWQGVVFRFFPGPFVYRILVPYLYSALNNTTHLSLLTIDLYVKVLLLIACQYALLDYLTRFFEGLPALLGVFIFDSLLGYLFSYVKGPSITETIDILNFLIITLGLTAIHGKNFLYLCILLFIGLLNRETPLILLPIAFLYEWLENGKLRHSYTTLIVSIISFLGTRILIQSWAGSTWFNINELQANLESGVANARLLLLLGPFILLSVYKFGEHPRYLKITASAAPILILIHFIVADIIEARLWFPIFPLLLPLVVNNLVKLRSRTVN
jgi:hypothetical protein